MPEQNKDAASGASVRRSKYADIPIAQPHIANEPRIEVEPTHEEIPDQRDSEPAEYEAPINAAENSPKAMREAPPVNDAACSNPEERDIAASKAKAEIPLRQFDQKPRRRSSRISRRSKIIIAYILIFVVALIVVDSALSARIVYPGVHVGSVDVSNMTIDEAIDALHERYGDTVGGKDILICADEDTLQKVRNGKAAKSANQEAKDAERNNMAWTISAQDLQAQLSIDELAQSAFEVGRSAGGPLARFEAITTGIDIPVSVSLNEDAVESTVKTIEDALCTPREDYDVRIEEGTARVVEGKEGTIIDREDFHAQLEELLYTSDTTRAFVPSIVASPTLVTKDQAQTCADTINEALERGAELRFNGATEKLNSAELAALIRVKTIDDPANGSEQDQDDNPKRIVAFLDDSLTNNLLFSKLYQAKDGSGLGLRFTMDGQNPRVHIAQSDHVPDVTAAREQLQGALFENQGSSDMPFVDIGETTLAAEMSLQEALEAGIVTVIAEYETDFVAGATARNHNIALASEIINNSIVPADGGVWSFNDVAGDCNEERGFQGAGSIIGSEVVDEIGGGVCQVATTVFNAVYEAGYPVDDRRNHSLLMEGYPIGRDAAISWPDLDFVWHNDTSNDILLQTRTSDSWTSVSLLGVAPLYAVTTEVGEWSGGESYSSQTRVNEDLDAGESRVTQEGADGGNITVSRTVKDSTGAIIREDVFESVYDPRDEIIEVGPEID